MGHAKSTQAGMTLIESLIAILIFSIGILALVGMFTAAIQRASDAQYRIEAANLANEIIGRMWSSVDRTPPVPPADPLGTSLATFAYNTAGADCAFSGGDSGTEPGLTQVTQWVARAAALKLPDVSQQVLIEANNRVTVTICWKPPGETQFHRHTSVTTVN